MGKSFAKNPMVSNPVDSPAIRDPRTVLPRDQVDDSHDPYLPEGSYPADTVCRGCGAVWQNQHWAWDDKRRDLLARSGAANEVLCAGCRITAGRDPQGILTLSGEYWPAHRDDIMNLVRNEERAGSRDNPIERVMSVRDEEGRLVIETTTEKLAQRIGKAIHSAHKGDVRYQWSDGNQLVRVYWER